jgi:hypothetical protein
MSGIAIGPPLQAGTSGRGGAGLALTEEPAPTPIAAATAASGTRHSDALTTTSAAADDERHPEASRLSRSGLRALTDDAADEP